MLISKSDLNTALDVGDDAIWDKIFLFHKNMPKDRYILGFDTRDAVSLLDREMVSLVIERDLSNSTYLEFNEAYLVHEDIHDPIESGIIERASTEAMKYLDEKSISYFTELSDLVEEVLMKKYFKDCEESASLLDLAKVMYIKVNDFKFLSSFFEFEEQVSRGIPLDYLIEEINILIKAKEEDGISDGTLYDMHKVVSIVSIFLKKNQVDWCIIELDE